MDINIVRNHFLAILISLVLLPAGVLYFLKSEYDNHKRSLETEKREFIYESIFSRIDTFGHSFDPSSNEGSVRWVKDSIGSSVSYTLSLVSDSLDYIAEFETDIISDSLLNTEFNNNIEKHHISIQIIGDDSTETLIEERKIGPPISFAKKNLKLSRTHQHDTICQDSIFLVGHPQGMLNDFGYIKIIHEEDNPRMMLDTEEVSSSEVLKSMFPQILFSLFLLLCVWYAFYTVISNLNKERHLSMIRNDFISNMSHELKTPVSTIAVALEALSNFDAADNPELRKEYISISRRENERLGLLVDKALNISLFEQGKFIMDLQSFDIKEEIDKIVKTLQVSLDNQNVELDFNATGNNHIIYADKVHMTNIIHNLIENAIKYSEGQAKVKIDITELDNNIRISISDQGKGIPQEYQSRVFDKFFRVPTGDTHNVKGHGLGLSYVKEAVVNQRGKISMISNYGVGTEFIITMPKKEML